MLRKQRIFATLPRTERGNAIVIGSDPKGKNFLYTNGNSVIIRNIRNPEISDIYTEHSFQTTVAKYSPSGFYICSADITGKIRIWDTVNEEHILKAEYQPFVGTVKDISWSNDSQRLAIVGEGREKFGAVINMDTGTTLGEINGHSKRINSVDFTKKRPFKIVTGSDDNFIGIYEGPPFKFKNQLEDHKKYVQVVRFSPDNQLFASGGFDGKLIIYKSETGEKLVEVDAHKGGINGAEWSPDSKELLTCSGDKTVKIFDVEAQKVRSELLVGKEIVDQQMGCLWQQEFLLSVSLSGFINYFDQRLESIAKVVRGHNKPITALAVDETNTVYTGACDGTVCSWDLTANEISSVAGGHSNQVADLIAGEDCVYSLGLDDLLKFISKKDKVYSDSQLKLDSQPRGGAIARLSNGEETLFIASYQHILVVANQKILERKQVVFEPNCVAVSPSGKDGDLLVAVGGAKDKRVHLYSVSGSGHLEEVDTKEPLLHRDAVTCLKFSPDARYLAATDANRKVIVYDREAGWELAHQVDWGNHSARVNSVDWFPDSQQLVSGSLDTSLVVWDMRTPMKPVQLRKAHPLSAINRVHVMPTDPLSVLSVGQDSNLKLWSIAS